MATATCLPVHSRFDTDSLLALANYSNDLLIARTRQGISVADVRNLLTTTGLQATHLAQALNITPSTLLRRLRQTGYVFKGKDAAAVMRVAKVFTQATRVFEMPERARRWLETPNPTLPNAEMPISFLNTEFGAELVAESLLRIAHGIFA